MKEPLISSLRSVDFGLPDVAAAEAFYTHTWRLSVVARQGGSVYLRGTGAEKMSAQLARTLACPSNTPPKGWIQQIVSESAQTPIICSKLPCANAA